MIPGNHKTVAAGNAVGWHRWLVRQYGRIFCPQLSTAGQASSGTLRSFLPQAPITVLLLLASGVALVWPEIATLLEYHRTNIIGGQFWRVVTGHLTHWNLDHWFWDAAMFGLLGIMCERRGRARYAICLTAAAVLISLAVWHVTPGMQTYRGLSGIDSALFGLVAAELLRQKWAEGNWKFVALIVALALGFTAKLAYEFLAGATVFVDSGAAGFLPVPLAHAVGLVTGVLCGTIRVSNPRRAATLLRTPGGAGPAKCNRRSARS